METAGYATASGPRSRGCDEGYDEFEIGRRPGDVTHVIVGAALAATVLSVPVEARASGDDADRGDTTTVLPGDERLEADRLVPHRATWRVTVHDAGGGSIVQGLWTDVWARSQEEGRPVVVFRQLYVDTTGAILVDNETVFEAESFRALRSSQHLPPTGGRVSYRYEGDTASGTLRRGTTAEPRDFEVVFDQPVWDPLAPVNLLLPLERQEPGTVVRFPIWNQIGSGDDVTWTLMRVDSAGPAELADGSTVEAMHLTMRTLAAPNTLMRLRQTADRVWWLRVERPALTREWTLVHWEPFTP